VRAHRLAVLALLSLVLPFARSDDAKGTSVVLFIGDGMGAPQITLGRAAAERLHEPYPLDRFKTIGLAETRAFDNLVTESSAAATALACARKTRNRSIGVDEEGRPILDLVQAARAAGLRTGLVTTARVTDSTPAGFAAHVSDRHEEDEIARQYTAGSAPDLLFGGGGKYFDDARRAAFRARGYDVIQDRSALLAAKGPRLLGLFSPDDMSFDIERDPQAQPSLAEMTEKALAVLGASGRPFFLMVEGGRIDHAGHYHDAAQVIREQLAFVRAVEVARARAGLLVIVTGDHATGSLGITERIQLDRLLAVKTSVETILADPACQKDDAALARAVKRATGIDLDAAEIASVRRPERPPARVVALGHAISKRFGVTFYEVDEQESQKVTRGHDGSLVPVFSAGPGEQELTGTYENTAIPLIIAKVLGIRPPGAKLY
jgi:alkaline phosphatase